MKKCALGDDFMVELRTRIEGQIHSLSSKPAKQILKNMKLKEIVQQYPQNQHESDYIVSDGYES